MLAGEIKMSKNMVKIKLFLVNIICIFKRIFKNNLNEDISITTNKRYGEKPFFISSFIQKWYAEDFTMERWIDELQMLKDIGIEEIIIQSTVDTKKKKAVYPTKINDYSFSEKDMILLALDAAKNVGIKVRIGLGENDDWWEEGWHNFNWLSEEAEINRKIVNEIFDNYGYHDAFGGWYIPYEFSEFFSTTKSQQINLNFFYKSIAGEIKSKNSNLDIMISPFYNSNKYKIGCLEVWSKAVEGVLKNTGIDVVSLQDSLGAGFNTEDNVGELFYYTKRATDSLGITLYADTETFIATDDSNIPANQDEIFTRMSKVKLYVKGFVAFSINQFQNKNELSQSSNYRNYLEYYNESIK
jgi:hypothetical protein